MLLSYPRHIRLKATYNMTQAARTVLITGCSSGIGQCVAEGLRQRGYRVFATARKTADVERLKQQGYEAWQLDLQDQDSIANAVDQVMQACDGRLYALFNNGAYGQPGALEDLSTDVLRQQFETNLFGWHELTRRIIPAMRARGEGRIIQNSSLLGYVSLPFRGAYNASKHALEGYSDTLRMELHGSGIHVSLIEPGPVKSLFRKNAMQAFHDNVTIEGSAFEDTYRGLLRRLQKKGPAMPFTLPPEAVLKKVIHALESKHPNPRYYVTTPSYLFGYAKRLLSTRQMDRILLTLSKKENE